MEIHIRLSDLSGQVSETAEDLRGLDLILRRIKPRVLELASLSDGLSGPSTARVYSLLLLLSLAVGIAAILVAALMVAGVLVDTPGAVEATP